MTEIPEHLLKRAQAARDKAAGGDASASSGGDRIPDDVLAEIKERMTTNSLPRRETRPWLKICRCGHPEAYHSPDTGADRSTITRNSEGMGRYIGAACFGALGRYGKFGMETPHCGCKTFEPWIEAKGGGRIFRQNPKGHDMPPLMRGLMRVSESNAEREASGKGGAEIKIRWLIAQRCHRCAHVGPDVLPYFADDSDHTVQMGCSTCRSAAPVYIHPGH